MPCVDGVPLSDLVASYEERNGFEPSGGYGALIPEWFKYGPLDQYFFGQTGGLKFWTAIGAVYLLGCRCGEVGCWPLECKIDAVGQDVTWRDFRQPFRPERDYSRFGPFVFARTDYDLALLKLFKEMSEP